MSVASRPPLTSVGLYRRLLGHILPYWKVFLVALVSMLLAALTETGFAALMKPLVDANFVTPDPSRLYQVPLMIVALFVVRGTASYLNEVCMAWISTRLVQDLRELMFARLLRLPVRFYDDHASGRLISRLTFDVAQVTQAGVNIITVSVKDSLTILGLLAWLLFIQWQLTVICLAVVPLVALSVRTVSHRLRKLSRAAQQAMGGVTQVLGEAIDAQRVVKVFGGQQHEATRFRDNANQLRRLDVKQAAASAANSALVQLLIALALAAIVYFASSLAMRGDFTPGDFVSFMTAMMMLFAPIKRLTGVNVSLQRGLAAAESVFALLDEEAEPDSGSQTLGRAQGRLSFRDVSFYYRDPERLALRAVSFDLEPGQTVALVGGSGGGKTTIANLIPRFYAPSSGSIWLDDVDLQQLRLDQLREQIAMVSQDVVLFNGTVAENIAYGGCAQASEAEIVAAAEAAHAMGFIRELPQGLNTLIGENGLRLSGGQRQRLAIARALLKNAPILVLDEATSALDTESERQVQAALETLMQGRTTLVIAHRLSTIEKADCILVLQQGAIVERGTHAELLARSGVYAHLYRMQFSAQEPEA